MDASTPNSIRKSGRQRKQTEIFGTQGSSGGKRKRADGEEESDGEFDEGLEEELDDEEDERSASEQEQEEYVAPRPKAPKTRAPKRAKTAAESMNPKLRAKKADVVTRPRAKGKAKGKGKAADAANGEGDAKNADKDTPVIAAEIPTDNHLFNALLNPSTSFQTLTEDFLDALRESPLAALADIITMVVRCCGAPGEVTAEEVGDEDGVVGVCEDMMEGVKQAQAPPYPLISKLIAMKVLRKALPSFLSTILTSSHSSAQLYTTELIPTLLSWLTTMSSSSFRSFRHTSTYVAACIVAGLCEVGAGLEKEVGVVGRQREAERKKKGKETEKGKKGKGKDPLERRWDEVRERKKKIEEFLKEFFDGVFVHRYRDYDPEIRAECIRELGGWMKTYSAHFLDGQYLRYVGWVLSDSNTHVRLEALKALAPLYSLPSITALHHFTTRFLPRLMQIALADTDVPVRCAAIAVLTEIDEHKLWGEEEGTDDRARERMCQMVWDREPRVRRAVGAFWAGVWRERVEEVMSGADDVPAARRKAKGKEKEGDREKVGVKQLAALLVRLERLLDAEEDHAPDDPHSAYIARQVSTRLPSAAGQPQSRISLAVEALWSHVEAVKAWELLLEVLLVDHSKEGEDSPRKRKAKAGRANGDGGEDQEEQVDERWRLEEREEGILLEVLVSSLAKTRSEAEAAKKTDAQEVKGDMTRSLMGSLPKLFTKHQTDANRIADVLLVPRLMELDLFVEMREIKAYEQLWDDVSQQFLKHTEPAVLRHAVGTLLYLLGASASLANVNTRKCSELEDELFTSLRDAVAGRDELELANFNEDEIHALGAVSSRLACLFSSRDLTTAMEEDEGGKQSSAWDILCALAERGRLGYKEEEAMVDQCLKALNLHIVWKTKNIMAIDLPDLGENEEDPRKHALRDQRSTLLEKLTEFAVGTQSNACEAIRRSSFDSLLTMHILFAPQEVPLPDGKRTPGSILPLQLDDEVQYRCSGFMQAEIEKYSEEVEEAADNADEEEDKESDSDALGKGSNDSDEADKEAEKDKRGKKGSKEGTKMKVKASKLADVKISESRLEHEYLFCSVIFTFLRAVRVGVVHIRHAPVLLAHYGRFGPTVDQCLKHLVDVLRDEGIHARNGEAVATAIAKSVEDAFELYLDGVVGTDGPSIALAKALASAFVIRGTHLAIVKRLPHEHVIGVHRDGIDWIISRIQTYADKNKKKLPKAISFFRVLTHLLITIEPKEALDIKIHMDTAIKDAHIEMSDTSKIWEPQRAYEKRLNTAMAKDKVIGEAAKAVVRKGPAKSPEVANGDGAGDDDAAREPEARARAQRRLRPRPRAKKAVPGARSEVQNSVPDEDMDGQDKENEPIVQEKSVAAGPSRVPQANGVLSPVASAVNGNGKRPREEEEDDFDLGDGEVDEEEQEALAALIERGRNQGIAPASQEDADFKSRHKRRRR